MFRPDSVLQGLNLKISGMIQTSGSRNILVKDQFVFVLLFFFTIYNSLYPDTYFKCDKNELLEKLNEKGHKNISPKFKLDSASIKWLCQVPIKVSKCLFSVYSSHGPETNYWGPPSWDDDLRMCMFPWTRTCSQDLHPPLSDSRSSVSILRPWAWSITFGSYIMTLIVSVSGPRAHLSVIYSIHEHTNHSFPLWFLKKGCLAALINYASVN